LLFVVARSGAPRSALETLVRHAFKPPRQLTASERAMLAAAAQQTG
jgi:hypothetical protein